MNGSTVFLTANWYAAASTDSGVTFTYLDPATAFSVASGYSFCCDQDTIYDPSRGLTLWTLMYLNGPGTDSFVKLAVAHGQAGVASNSWTSWNLTAQNAGFAVGNWLDYPHLSLSSNYAYLSANVFTGSTFVAAVAFRMPLDSLSAGGTLPLSSFSNPADYMQPVSGATSTMYFARHLSTSSLRLYTWSESVASSGVTLTDMAHSSFPYETQATGVCTAPDSFNACARDDSRMKGGWLAGGVLGFLWDAKQGSGLTTFPYPYVHVARFSESSKTLVDEPIIWSASVGFSYASVAANSRGHLGVSMMYAGSANYPSSDVAVLDDISPSIWQGLTVRAGTNAPPTGNWGDFSVVRAVGTTWITSTWTLQGGTAASNVEPRFVRFGRQRDDSSTPPMVSAISPTSGPASGGTAVTISGTNFATSATVTIGGTAAAGVTVVSATQITATTPAHAAGAGDVVVRNPDTQSGTCAGCFTYTAPPPTGGPYTPLPPARILDTRPGSGQPYAGQTLGPGSTLAVQVRGVGGVPATGVTAVVLNVTVTEPNAASFLTVFPTGVSRPLASNLNWVPGQTVPNLVEVALGADGTVSFFNSGGSVDVIADVQGYVSGAVAGTAGLFNPLVPARILDTRPGSGQPHAGQTMTIGSSLDLQVTGVGGVPGAAVAAVVLNVTVTAPTDAGFLTVFPTGVARPLASNLNFVPGQTVPNLVIAAVGTAGTVQIFNSAGNVDVIADVVGWFTDGTDPAATGSLFSGLTPARITDTRPGSGQPNAGLTLGTGGTLSVAVAGRGGVPVLGGPAAPTAAVLNVTVTEPNAASFLTVFPTGVSRPLASNLNWVPGQTVPNLVVVKLGPDGTVTVFNSGGNVDVIVDVVGWYW
jgi:hypothetical protein